MPHIGIRQATPDDAELVASFIVELARYEGLESEARPDADALKLDLDPEDRYGLRCLIANCYGKDVGFALCFFSYSTFLTKWGIFLEDIYVQEEFRGQGIATALFRYLGNIAQEEGCERIDLNVLKWNKDAIRRYERLGAQQLKDWTPMRFGKDAIKNLCR